MTSALLRTLRLFVLLLVIGLISTFGLGTNVHAVNQSGATTWSPYGPRLSQMLITSYADFNTMFTNFQSGQIDITDWPVPPSMLSSFGSNPDFFLTNKTPEFGIFQLDINHHASFMGMLGLANRTLTTPGVIGTPITSPGCTSGFGRVNIVLKNYENGSAIVKDSLNTVNALGPQTFSTMDIGGATPKGVYSLPSPTTCMLAGNYNVTSTVYSGKVTVFVNTATITNVTIGVNYNSPSTMKLTSAGVDIDRALAHMVDKPNLVQNAPAFAGLADYDDIQVPPAQGMSIGGAPYSKLPQSVLNQECVQLAALDPTLPCNPISAYDLVAANIGAGTLWWNSFGIGVSATSGYASTSDIRAACDYFIAAGFAITPSTSTCTDVANAASGTTPLSSYPHLVPNGQLSMYIRTDGPRSAYGTIVADTLNFLFGTPSSSGGGTVCFGPTIGCKTSPQYYTISAVVPVVFSSGQMNNWNLYTGGFSLGTTPDHLYSIYYSQFASTLCGGPNNIFPSDFPYYCNPAYDADVFAGEFSTSLTASIGLFSNAAVIAYQTGMTIPIYSKIDQFVGLNGWNFQPSTMSSLVSVLGHGLQAGFWSLLNMRQNPGFVPSNSIYTPGGGSPNLIRRGFSQGTDSLSPFQALTVWDFEVISQVFDSMLELNPLTGGSNQQLIDWMTTSHGSTYSATEISCVGPPSQPKTVCVTGTTTETWRLRSDLFFHDGSRVTAQDVAYTILAYRDVPSSLLQSNVATVSSAVALDSTTLQVKLQNQSPFYEINIGSLPVLPKHLWASFCGDPPSPSSQCANPSFDPMAQGIFVGSGPWTCKNLTTGTPGGPCTSTKTQAMGLGDTLLLTAYPNYMRGPAGVQGTSLQALTWADKNGYGVVNILDIASTALHFCVSAPCAPGTAGADPYWANPLYTCPGDTWVDICAIGTAAGYFGHGLTNPFPPSQLTGIDPQVNPFQIDLTGAGGPLMYYEGGLRTSSGQLNIQLVALSGTPVPSSFSGTLTSGSTVVGTVAGIAGSTASVVVLPYTSISAGAYKLQIKYNGTVEFTITINA
jgi:ABC-type transport system substrate-binding protein